MAKSINHYYMKISTPNAVILVTIGQQVPIYLNEFFNAIPE
jgi:hypothetical protein